ncbi:MAG: hypothetical protein WC588_01005 [Candidatus Micrarchaeia archaeon]
MGAMFDYDELAKATVDAVCNAGQWHRAVSVDLETKIMKRGDFLSGERLLGIGFARRIGEKVETRTLRLKDDSDGAEAELLNEAARWLFGVRPLLLLGYNIAGYDYPLLSLKIKWYDERAKAACKEGEKPIFPREYWALKDAMTRAFVLDMMHPLRFEIARHDSCTAKYRSLSFIVSHKRFEGAKLMRRKGLAESNAAASAGKDAPAGEKDRQMDKGMKIYEMWKGNDPAFESYLEGDVHDVLLLAEEIYRIGKK